MEKVMITAPITVSDLARAIDVDATAVVGELMKNGVMATINDSIDFDTAAIVAGELGAELVEGEVAGTESKPSSGRQPTILAPGEGELRSPVVAVMGHVDHGKTTLLDALRDSNVAAGEAGGITQHISAYQTTHQDRTLTFLDTPGHEAFSVLREHGARLTDVAIIVIAADDGIKPQTKEAINYARESGVRMIVAVNKIDKPEADPNRIRQQLADMNLIPEEWGGETVVVDISAARKQNLDKLLDMVLLVADLEDLRADMSAPMEGTVIESQMVTGKGAVATVLVQNGTLKTGMFIVAGDTYGKVRSIEDFRGDRIRQATPPQPVMVSGWKTAPRLGAFVYETENEKAARTEAASGAGERTGTSSITQAEAMTAAMTAGQASTVPVLVKADVDGSLSAVTQSIDLLRTDEVRAEIVSSGVGPISESDITLAESSGATIIGFNVPVSGRIKQLASRAGVEIELYSVIYELIDSLRERLSALLAPEIIEEEIATLAVKGVFKTTQNEVICGGEVTSGKLTDGLLVRIRDGEEIGSVAALQREQQPAKEIIQGELCGVSIKTPQKVKLSEGDVLVFFSREAKERSL